MPLFWLGFVVGIAVTVIAEFFILYFVIQLAFLTPKIKTQKVDRSGQR